MFFVLEDEGCYGGRQGGLERVEINEVRRRVFVDKGQKVDVMDGLSVQFVKG